MLISWGRYGFGALSKTEALAALTQLTPVKLTSCSQAVSVLR